MIVVALSQWRVIALDKTLRVLAFGQDTEGHAFPRYQISSAAYGGCTAAFAGSPVSCSAPRGGSCEADRVGIDAELKAFEKRCSNYRFAAAGQPLLATLTYVPEIEETFLEIETLVGSEIEVGPALETIRQVMGELEIGRNDETTEAYTEAVATRRNKL
jgi:hypothetical protein